MGIHAFSAEPAHCHIYRSQVGPNLPPIFGLSEGWNMPAVRHRRALGAGIDFAGVDHYVLTYHIDGGAARRLDSQAPAAQAGALSLQAPGSGGRFSSNGVVEYGHLYFNQGLLCEIADEAGLGLMAEPGDFFAHHDKSWAADVATYLTRMGDTDDPPLSMEMDHRSYLIGLGLLRSVRARVGESVKLVKTVSRPDMRAVLQMIEDRLSDPLRLSELADAAGMSPFHFARTFKAETGASPARYLRDRRTDRAIEMIRRTNLSLAEIAYRTGFSSQSHMHRYVKARSGATPGEIRGRE